MTTSHPLRLRRALIAVAATTVLTLSGCGGDDIPESTDTEPTESSSSTPTPAKSSKSPKQSPSASPTKAESAATVAVTVAGSEVTPLAKTLELGVGETLALDITSDRVGELHVHSTPEKELNFEPGDTHLELEFDQPGSVDIEEHESGALILRVLVK